MGAAILQRAADTLGAPRQLTDVLAPLDSAPSRKARRESNRRIRKLIHKAGVGADLEPALVEKLYPPIAGGASGQVSGVSFLSNLPAERFQINPQLFEASTERQDIPQPSQPFNGFGSSTSVRLQNVGVLSLITCEFTGSLVVSGTGAVTTLLGWPYGLFKRCQFNANGVTSIIGANGVTFRARERKLFRNPAESLETAPGIGGATVANGTYPIKMLITIPVSHDMFTGTGWVMAQNPSTSLSVDIAWANLADLFNIASGGAVALTGSLATTITTFAVGQAAVGQQSVTVVPDLTVYHGLLDNDFPIPSAGVVQAPLIRTAGQLVGYAFTLPNGTPASSEINPAALTEIELRYGGNRAPRVFNPPDMLINKNQEDYNGVVRVGGQTHTWLDFEADNPRRDLFLPESLVELQGQITIPVGVTVNAGAKWHYIQESLYPAV